MTAAAAPPDTPERRRRATSLPPDERRAAICQATARLLRDHGAGVTTRQIAEAAGVAEGTIFRVFPDKDAVLEAAVESVLDPAPAEDALAQIDRDLPFEDQLEEAVTILQRRLADIWRVLSAVHPEGGAKRPHGPPPVLVNLLALFEDHADTLRIDPTAATRQLRALTLATSHPVLAGDETLSPREIVELFLDGNRRRPTPTTPPTRPTPARRR